MHINYREATIQDKQQLLQLLSQRQDEVGKTKNLVFTTGVSMLEEIFSNKQTKIVVGEDQGNIIAMTTMYLLPRVRDGGYWALFEDVLVAKEYRGKGIGKKLMEYAIDVCKQNKQITKIKLGTRTDRTVFEFYEKLGFEHKEKLMQLTLR